MRLLDRTMMKLEKKRESDSHSREACGERTDSLNREQGQARGANMNKRKCSASPALLRSLKFKMKFTGQAESLLSRVQPKCV